MSISLPGPISVPSSLPVDGFEAKIRTEINCQTPSRTGIGSIPLKTVERQRALHASRRLRFGRELSRTEYGRGVLAPKLEAAKAQTFRGGTSLTEKEQLEAQNAVLREELQSLRERYAKHIAITENTCEQLLREKDVDSTKWYKMRKLEIKDMKAGVVIMSALYEKRKLKFQAQMEADQAAFAEREHEFNLRVEKIERERQEESKRMQHEIATMKTEYERKLQDMTRLKNEWETKSHQFEEKLRDAKEKLERTVQDHDHSKAELAKVRAELAESIRNLESDKRDVQIQALQEEVKETKRAMRDRWRRDVENLRRELMDYVAFIVHILPDNWAESELGQKAPPELRERLMKPIITASGAKFVEAMLSSPGSPSLGTMRPASAGNMGYSSSTLPSLHSDAGGQSVNLSPPKSAPSTYQRRFLG